MAYSDIEISTEDGSPVWFLKFEVGTQAWFYTTADENETIGDDEWIAANIGRSEIVQGAGAENDLTLTLPTDLEIVSLFDGSPPSEIMYVTISSRHVGDAEMAIEWIGTVGNIKKVNPAEANAICRNLVASFERGGLRLTWGRQCPHALYDWNCRVDKTLHDYPYVIEELTANSFVVTGYAAPAEGSFVGGFVEWSMGTGRTERRAIEREADGAIYIIGFTNGLEIGSNVTLYPGCPRTTEGCLLFDNLPNYGGIPHLPGKSPFDGTPVF
jgi:uncharacterized phage protein (TIGR02218 family)